MTGSPAQGTLRFCPCAASPALLIGTCAAPRVNLKQDAKENPARRPGFFKSSLLQQSSVNGNPVFGLEPEKQTVIFDHDNGCDKAHCKPNGYSTRKHADAKVASSVGVRVP